MADIKDQALRNADNDYRADLHVVATRLRDLADRVQREGEPRSSVANGDDERDDYLYAAGRVVGEVAKGLGHLNLPYLIASAKNVHMIRDLL